MDREAAVKMWREIGLGLPGGGATGRLIEAFAVAVEAAESERRKAEIERLRAENATFRNAQRACEHCDPAGHDAAVVAERERAAAILKARADKIAAEADRAVNSEPDEVSALRAMAWQLTVAEREIRGA